MSGNRPVAVITGVTGQDGSYLARYLLGMNYEVYGLARHITSDRTWRLTGVKDLIKLRKVDITDEKAIERVIKEARPNEFYNLAAQSYVPNSWSNPVATTMANSVGVINCLEAIKSYREDTGLSIRFFQAGTSEQFGKVSESPQNEATRFHPRSPYGVSKVHAYHMVRNYRESYELYACSALSFNHESPFRSEHFVTQKIIKQLIEIVNGEREVMSLGNLEAKRDWGYAMDYVEAYWLMLQQDSAKDYVVATNEMHSVREFVEEACNILGLQLEWRGSGLNEVGLINGLKRVEVSERFYRPAEVDELQGDYSLIKKELGWEPSTTFKELINLMIKAELERLA